MPLLFFPLVTFPCKLIVAAVVISESEKLNLGFWPNPIATAGLWMGQEWSDIIAGEKLAGIDQSFQAAWLSDWGWHHRLVTLANLLHCITPINCSHLNNYNHGLGKSFQKTNSAGDVVKGTSSLTVKDDGFTPQKIENKKMLVCTRLFGWCRISCQVRVTLDNLPRCRLYRSLKMFNLDDKQELLNPTV